MENEYSKHWRWQAERGRVSSPSLSPSKFFGGPITNLEHSYSVCLASIYQYLIGVQAGRGRVSSPSPSPSKFFGGPITNLEHGYSSLSSINICICGVCV